MSTEMSIHQAGAVNLSRFMPQDITQLVKLADTASKSGLFGPMSPQQATIIAMYGAELGVNPLTAFREIHLIPGKGGKMLMLPSAALTSGLIQRSGDVESWDVDSDEKHCKITFKRRGRSEQSLEIKIEDIPRRYFAESKNGAPSQWTLIPTDMLYAWAVRRVARRHFADKLVAIQDENWHEDVDQTRIVDVAAIEHRVGDQATSVCDECGETAYLWANPRGGAYMRCANGHTSSPPQTIRDEVRGHHKALPEATVPSGAAERDLTAEEREEWGATMLEAIATPDEPIPDGAQDAEPIAAGDPGAPEPDYEFARELDAEVARARADWTAQILAALKAGMVNGKPSDDHVFVLATFGWDKATKVSQWLFSLTNDSVVKLRNELVPAPQPRTLMEAAEQGDRMAIAALAGPPEPPIPGYNTDPTGSPA